MSAPVATYIRELGEIRSTGAAVKETSSYGTLANLLNEVGKSLKPRVRCIINLANQGNGLPDGGLFTPDQFQRAGEAEPLPGQLPSRGAIEVKGTGDDIQTIAESEQVDGYWKVNGQVLVTNYRDFILIGRDPEGRKTRLEEYRLAPSESTFWEAARHPHKLAEEQGERFLEYLKRVMLHAAPLSAPKDVAWFLASYARDAKARIEEKARATGGELPALANVRVALEQALGIKFEGEKGWIFVDRGRIEASEPKLLEKPVPKDAVRLARCGHHMLNFFSCVRSRNRPVSDAEVGHRSATVCLLGNIALRLGHELTWDPVSERFTGARAAEANAMLSRPMRSPWTLEA